MGLLEILNLANFAYIRHILANFSKCSKIIKVNFFLVDLDNNCNTLLKKTETIKYLKVHLNLRWTIYLKISLFLALLRVLQPFVLFWLNTFFGHIIYVIFL